MMDEAVRDWIDISIWLTASSMTELEVPWLWLNKKQTKNQNQKKPWNLEAAVGRWGETILAAHRIPEGVLLMISTIRLIAGYGRKSSSMKCSVRGSLEVTPSIPRLSLMLWMSGTKGFYRKFSIVFRWFCCCRRRTKLFIVFIFYSRNKWKISTKLVTKTSLGIGN